MEIKKSSNKSFGVVFFLFFLIISFYPLFNSEKIRVWSLVISLFFLCASFIFPKILTPLNILWFKFGILLGKVVSPIVMSVIFFLVVTPIGFFMRIINKDLLNLKLNDEETYWIKKTEPKSKMKNQF